MAKRKNKKKASGHLPYGRIFFWFLLIVETLWLGAFIWSARSPFPAAIVQDARQHLQERADNKELEELLTSKNNI